LLKEQSFFSCGKFLITSEYFVLDGAIGLALPTQQGQRLTVSTLDSETFSLQWNSYDANNHVWLSAVFLQQHFENEFTAFENKEINTLLHILKEAKKLNATFLASPAIIEVNTHLDFPNNWGLGSSATLINNIANWAQVNPFLLIENTFGGSGYDIAVAQVQHVITFQRKNNIPFVEKININWPFTENLFFVHLNKKQNSREGIAHYKQIPIDKHSVSLHLNEITQQLILADNLATFENLLKLSKSPNIKINLKDYIKYDGPLEDLLNKYYEDITKYVNVEKLIHDKYAEYKNLKWNEFVEKEYIQYVDNSEVENAVIAMDDHDLEKFKCNWSIYFLRI
jgi:mevalonate kinase